MIISDQGRHARRVEAAATALGYNAAGLVAQRVAALRPERRLGFPLQRRGSAFYRNLATEPGRAVRARHQSTMGLA